MNNKLNLITKIVASFIMLFSFLKMLIFPQRLFSILHITILELQGKHVSLYEKQYAFNAWILFTDLVESFLFFMLFYYILQMFKGQFRIKQIIFLCLAIILLFYPLLLILNCFMLGKNSLMGIIPAFFSVIFLSTFTLYLYLLFFYKK